MQIAIDGPSGAGKSTIAKIISELLDIEYLDTGAMYRALAVEFKNRGFTDYDNLDMLNKLFEDIEIEIKNNKIFLNGKDISEAIRDEDIGLLASKISKYPAIREYLVDLQRKIAEDNDIVMDGRDIGTVVLKDADYKIFLTASLEKRAERRYLQLIESDKNANMEKIRRDLELRDYNDKNRKMSPLKIAEDAYVIDSTDCTIDETVQKIMEIIK